MRRESGFPASGNGASSFHCWWEGADTGEEVSVDLEVVVAPDVPHLYFWALQVSFREGGLRAGGAHLGLQWNSRHPGSTAANWGGYSADGSLLSGSPSALPSAPGDPNTRDYPWTQGTVYRLTIAPGSRSGRWRGSVTDLSTGGESTVRELDGGGDRLTDPVVWAEVFARCDDPSTEVRWTRPRLRHGSEVTVPHGVRVTYQPERDGGCSNTDVRSAEGIVQVTATPRTTRDRARIPWP